MILCSFDMRDSPNKITLEEYLQAHKIKKKLEERHRAKNRKSQEEYLAQDQQESMQLIFGAIDQKITQTKLDIQEALELNYTKNQLLVFLSAAMDRIAMQVKEHVRNMYKEVYMQYNIEFQHSPNPQTQDFMKHKLERADSQIKKMHLKELIRQKFKQEERHEVILNAIFKTGQKHAPVHQVSKTPQEHKFIQALKGLAQPKPTPVPIQPQKVQHQPDFKRGRTKKLSLSPSRKKHE